ncbi:MAG: alpha/beta fold hydrolase [Deltaproteobacteria bacterium]|nr:MAG: alpha/beta fold hydrolase [Deltaproteobacteria bacterium]
MQTRRAAGAVALALIAAAFVSTVGRAQGPPSRRCPPPNLPPGVELGDAKLRYTQDCLPFVRTPRQHTRSPDGFPYVPRFAKVDGLRMAYVDVGPRDGEVILLLHGEPSWSYLYRRMIPILADAGFRVIAADLIGMGRSDKPVEFEAYSYLQHVAWVEAFLDAVPRRRRDGEPRGLRDITLFCQDWGSLIGLRVVGDMPDRFARVVVANGRLPVVPFEIQLVDLPDPPLLDPELPFPFDEPCTLPRLACFGRWATYALTSPNFRPSDVVEVATAITLTDAERAAYDAPYPELVYRTGPRVFPSLINTLGEAPTNVAARAVFDAFEKPLLTLFGRLDPNLGSEAVQAELRDTVPGAVGQPHHAYPDAHHFIQEDKGEDLAWRVVEFMHLNPLPE